MTLCSLHRIPVCRPTIAVLLLLLPCAERQQEVHGSHIAGGSGHRIEVTNARRRPAVIAAAALSLGTPALWQAGVVPPRTPPEQSSATSGSIPSFRDAGGVSPSSPVYSDEYISPTNGYSSPPNGCANQCAPPV